MCTTTCSCGEIKKTLVEKSGFSGDTIYSQTSMARTPMARLPWLIRTRF